MRVATDWLGAVNQRWLVVGLPKLDQTDGCRLTGDELKDEASVRPEASEGVRSKSG